MNDESYLAKNDVLRSKVIKDDDQHTIDGFKIFVIVENVKAFEFSRLYYAMTFGVQNLFWICGPHQNLILMEWLVKQSSISIVLMSLMH